MLTSIKNQIVFSVISRPLFSMNLAFVIFMVLPLLFGWIGFSLEKTWLVEVSVALVCARAVLILITVPKIYDSFIRASGKNKERYRTQLTCGKGVKATSFVASIIIMWSLLEWSQLSAFFLFAVSTGVMYGMMCFVENKTR